MATRCVQKFRPALVFSLRHNEGFELNATPDGYDIALGGDAADARAVAFDTGYAAGDTTFTILKLDTLFLNHWWATPRSFIAPVESSPQSSSMFRCDFDHEVLLPAIWSQVFGFAVASGGPNERLDVWVQIRSVCKSWRLLADDAVRWTGTQLRPSDSLSDDWREIDLRFRSGMIAEWSIRRLVPLSSNRLLDLRI